MKLTRAALATLAIVMVGASVLLAASVSDVSKSPRAT